MGALLLVGFLLHFLPGSVSADIASQIVEDTSVQTGLGTTVTPNGTNTLFDVDGGTPMGNNLFHSFEFFTVGTNHTVRFNGDPGTANIFSRVVGGHQSMIDGMIQSTIPGANFALFNNQGIVFMENARLDIGTTAGQPGNFYASTADMASFDDGKEFFTALLNPDQTDVLSTGSIVEFGFLNNPADIEVQNSRLAVGVDATDPQNPTGKTFALIGGDITVTGNGAPPGPFFLEIPSAQLSAPNGTIKLASLSSPGEVQILSGQPYLQISAESNEGKVLFDQSAGVHVSDFLPFPPFHQAGGQSGKVVIRGGEFVMDNGSQVLAVNFLNRDAVNPAVDVQVSGNITVDHSSQILSEIAASPFGPGTRRSGDINLIAQDSIFVKNSGQVISRSSTIGTSGDVLVDAGNQVEVSSGGSVLSQSTSGGSAGNLTVNGGVSVTVTGNNSRVQSLAESGNGSNTGTVTINGGDLNINNRGAVGTRSGTSGKADDTTINSVNLNILSGAALTIDGNGIGSTGVLTVSDAQNLTVSGTAPSGEQSILANRHTGGGVGGSNGGVDITAQTVLVDAGARVSSETNNAISGPLNITADITASTSITVSGNSEVVSRANNVDVAPINLQASTITVNQSEVRGITGGDGIGAAMKLDGQNINIINGARVANNTVGGSGQGGPTTLTATNSILINGGSRVESNSESFATGPGGPITLNAQNAVMLTGSNTGLFSETSTSGSGGDISALGNQIIIENGATISTISTGQAANAGNAGDITIGGAATETILVENSTIRTNAANADGGNIKLDSNFMIQVVNSTISSSVGGGAGAGGNINFDPQWIVIQNSQILANAFGGPGGNITFTASEGIFIDPSSTVDASSQFGTSGSVDVQAPVKNIKGVIAPLPEHIVNLASLYAERCAAQKGGQFSSFVQGGPEGVPPAPGGFMPSPLQMGSLTPQAGTRFLNDTSSGTMVKRLGLDQGTDEHDWGGNMRWMFGDATQGCAA